MNNSLPTMPETEATSAVDTSTSLPRAMWRDDRDPVAQTAKSYERAIREIREAHTPMPWYKSIGGYLLGGVIGVMPGAAYYHMSATADKPRTQVRAHTAMTVGTIIGLEVTRELLKEAHDNKEKSEAGAALATARQQARTSYTESLVREKEEAKSAPASGHALG